MDHQAVDLFPRPLIRTQISVKNDIISFFYNTIKTQDNKKENKTSPTSIVKGLVHYHNDENVFNIYEELNELEKEILKSANFTYKKILNHKNDLYITNAWFNECAVGSSQFMHNHCNSVLSGTLYLNTDENTNIQFLSPYGYSDTVNNLVDCADMQEQNEFGYLYHYTHCTVNVERGDCLFWPSYMKHGYDTNMTPNRLSLSFNMMPKNFNHTYKI